MKLDFAHLTASLAAYLHAALPDTAICNGKRIQGVRTPLLVIRPSYSRLSLQGPGRWLRRIGLELLYRNDALDPEGLTAWEAVGETLDALLETVPYREGEGAALLRTHGREWRMEEGGLLYRLELQEFVTLPEEYETMRTLAMGGFRENDGNDKEEH